MSTSLFNRFGQPGNMCQNYGNDIRSQLVQAMKNPAIVLDILLQRGKINQQQYNAMYQYRNNPEMIYKYLFNNGNANELKQAEQDAGQISNNNM